MMFKSSVAHIGVQPQIWYAIGVADQVYRSHGVRLVVTSLLDSHAHKPNSLHLKGLGVDIRTSNVPPDAIQQVRDELAAALRPNGFDVVLESNHIHIEYDPKGTATWLTVA